MWVNGIYVKCLVLSYEGSMSITFKTHDASHNIGPYCHGALHIVTYIYFTPIQLLTLKRLLGLYPESTNLNLYSLKRAKHIFGKNRIWIRHKDEKSCALPTELLVNSVWYNFWRGVVAGYSVGKVLFLTAPPHTLPPKERLYRVATNQVLDISVGRPWELVVPRPLVQILS